MADRYSLYESPWSVALENVLQTAYPIWSQRRLAKQAQEQVLAERQYAEQQQRQQMLFNLATKQVEGERAALNAVAQRRIEQEKLEQSQAFQMFKLEQDFRNEQALRQMTHGFKMAEITAGREGREETEKPIWTIQGARKHIEENRQQQAEWERYQATPDASEWYDKKPVKPLPPSPSAIRTLKEAGEWPTELRRVGRKGLQDIPGLEGAESSKALRIRRAMTQLDMIVSTQRTPEELKAALAKIATTFRLLNADGTLDDDFARALGLIQ